MMRALLLCLFCSTAFAATVDLDLAVAKAHFDHWNAECAKKPPKEIVQCRKDLNEAYAQAQKDIKAKHEGGKK